MDGPPWTPGSPRYVCAGQPQLQCGQGPSVVAVRPAGTGALRLVDALLPSRSSVLVRLPRSLLRPALVLGQEDVKVFPPAWHGSAVRQRVSLRGQQRADQSMFPAASSTLKLKTRGVVWLTINTMNRLHSSSLY